MRGLILAAALLGGAFASPASAAPPSVPAVDAPALAALGCFQVGYRSLTFAQPSRDRTLPVDVWYPATTAPHAATMVYSGALTGEDGKDVAFTTPGIAVSGAEPVAGAFPLVILAHGYGGTPAAMTWLAENLASKGYVVAAPHFGDPPYGEAKRFAEPLTRRPLDIAFVAAEAQARGRRHEAPFAAADPARTVLIGYSMGGYGVITAAGAPLTPALGPITHGALTPYVAGAPRAAELNVAGVVAVVAISPAGLFGGAQAWTGAGLAAVTAPSLFIVGDQDRTVGYEPGVKALWEQLVGAPRYLLTFENGGHSIGMNPAPETMRGRLWDQDWFEDPVWRKERVIGVELHFITAFLDRYAKGHEAADAYLKVPAPTSNLGVWPATPATAYAAVSPGESPVTVWKGFQKNHAQGLEMRFAPGR